MPITRPLEDSIEPNPKDFYDNIVEKLIPDIVRLEYNGIPIDLEQVQKTEQELNNVLQEVAEKLANNPLVQQYLQQNYNKDYKAQKEAILAKQKQPEQFFKPFNPKNKIHRSYVVNTYLQRIQRTDLMMSEWTAKDLKKLNQVISDKFLADLAANNIQSYMQEIIDIAMNRLAEEKADIYNKNQICTKVNNLDSKLKKPVFNPGSSLQKQEFFAMFGIESDKKTAKGNEQFDRKSLEQLQKLLTIMLEK